MMKKITYLLLILLIFNGCSSDDDNISPDLVENTDLTTLQASTWLLYQTVTEKPNPDDEFPVDIASYNRKEIEFLSDSYELTIYNAGISPISFTYDLVVGEQILLRDYGATNISYVNYDGSTQTFYVRKKYISASGEIIKKEYYKIKEN